MNVNRICPSEETLSEYISGILTKAEKGEIEKHIAHCRDCQRLLKEAHEILGKYIIYAMFVKISLWIRKNLWLLGAFFSFLASFFFPKYFFQFLVICLILGIKWIIDTKTTKMLITVYDAWQKNYKKEEKPWHMNKSSK